MSIPRKFASRSVLSDFFFLNQKDVVSNFLGVLIDFPFASSFSSEPDVESRQRLQTEVTRQTFYSLASAYIQGRVEDRNADQS